MFSTPTHYESGEEIPPEIRAILDMLNKKIESQEKTNRSLNARLDSLLTPQNTPGQQPGPGEVTALESARNAASAAQTSWILPPGVRLDFTGIQVSQGMDLPPVAIDLGFKKKFNASISDGILKIFFYK